MELKDYCKENKEVIDFYIKNTLKYPNKITTAKREEFVRNNENLQMLMQLEGVCA